MYIFLHKDNHLLFTFQIWIPKWKSVEQLRKNIYFCTFERGFPYAFDWKHDERHLPEQFAWRVEWRERGDTKIEVIECEFPICIYLICDEGSTSLVFKLCFHN